MGIIEKGEFELICRDIYGNIKWNHVAQNALSNEGQFYFLSTFLRKDSTITSFYVGLADSSYPCDITKVESLAQVVAHFEPPINYGYSRIGIEPTTSGWISIAIPDSETDYKATSRTISFAAGGGDIGPFSALFLTDCDSGTSGKHLAFAPITNSDFIVNSLYLYDGETLEVTYKIKLT